MNNPDPREEAIFDAALRLSGPERVAYLDKTCGGEPGLRQRVEGLLNALQHASGLMQQPAVVREKPHTVALPLNAAPGDRINNYKLLQQIGEGGCGVVYMAEQ